MKTQVFRRSTLVLLLLASHSALALTAEIVRVGDRQLLTWQSDRPVDIEALSMPEARRGKRLAQKVTTGEFLLPAEGSKRQYYRVTAGRESTITATRLLPLEGGRNFRDLGGYTTPEGKRVRWGRLFRSGQMSNLTAADYQYLSSLGIQVVCDLRSTEERTSEPTLWKTSNDTRYQAWDYSMEDDDTMRQLFAGGTPTPEQTRAVMTDLYHEIAYQQAPRYRYIFDQLAAGETPLAFNCSAGKDRAGVGAALILAALGVEEEQIIHDYSLSETFVDYMAEYTKEAAENSAYSMLARLPREVLAPLMRSDPDYLRATFEHLKSAHGSVLAFIQDELDVTDEELAAIRGALLE